MMSSFSWAMGYTLDQKIRITVKEPAGNPNSEHDSVNPEEFPSIDNAKIDKVSNRSASGL